MGAVQCQPWSLSSCGADKAQADLTVGQGASTTPWVHKEQGSAFSKAGSQGPGSRRSGAVWPGRWCCREQERRACQVEEWRLEGESRRKASSWPGSEGSLSG